MIIRHCFVDFLHGHDDGRRFFALCRPAVSRTRTMTYLSGRRAAACFSCALTLDLVL